MLTFIGLDLAWSSRNMTGGAVITGDATGGTLTNVVLLLDDATIADYVNLHAGDGPAIVAVDAPLQVPNATGRRPAEAELARVFRQYEAGAHPANRQRLACDGGVRGEQLVAALERRGFIHKPTITAGDPVRQVIEVFPHPAMVAIFGLERTLKYKARPQRPLALRQAEWQRYQDYLRTLTRADPALHGQEKLLAQDVTGLRGKRLKQYEDRVDALFCAYIALYAFRWGMARCRVFGNFTEGYIFTPVPEEVKG
jgi:predicted RNase H-like nuclease